jgi:hypothetical protein
LLADYIDSSEFPGGRQGKALAAAQSLSSLAISAGDRMVIEIGAQFQNTKTSGAFFNLDYGTNNEEVTGDLTAGSNLGLVLPGHIDFSNSISEQVEEQRYTGSAELHSSATRNSPLRPGSAELHSSAIRNSWWRS